MANGPLVIYIASSYIRGKVPRSYYMYAVELPIKVQAFVA